MAWSYRKRITIAPGIRLNVSKKGVSTTFGMRGASINVGQNGTYLNTGIPGTGIYQRQKISGENSRMPTPNQGSENNTKKPNSSNNFVAILFIFIFVTAMFVVDLTIGFISLSVAIILMIFLMSTSSKRKRPSLTEQAYNIEEYAVSQDDIELTIPQPETEPQEKDIPENENYMEPINFTTPFDPTLELPDYRQPILDLLKDYGGDVTEVNTEELNANTKRIVEVLSLFNITIDKIKATVGPAVTLYEIVPAPGIRISKIKNLENDIAFSLATTEIRIIAPIPGKGTIGIEVPNDNSFIVSIKSILESEFFQTSKFALPIALGKTTANENCVADLAKMPHLLMTGSTGQGKSVCINTIIASLLYKKHPAELKFIMVDLKKVELALFSKIERHYLAKLPDSDEAIITDTRKAVRTLNSLMIEMGNRYELLKDAQVRNMQEYNTKFIQRQLNPMYGHRFLSYIVLIVDEFADLIVTARQEIETPIVHLAKLAGIVGIHMIISTNYPSVDIITRAIQANFPARLAFRVTTKMDLRTFLDTGETNRLIGPGDMLFSTESETIRLQCAFIDTPEVEVLTEYIGAQRAYPTALLLPEVEGEATETKEFDESERDPLFEEAALIVVQTQQGSASMLQRELKLGYNRAGRIIDQLERAGVVSPFEGSKAREVKIANEMALEQFLKEIDCRETFQKNIVPQKKWFVEKKEEIPQQIFRPQFKNNFYEESRTLSIEKKEEIPQKISQPSKNNPYEELRTLIGLASVKMEISTLANFIKIQQERQLKGLKTSHPSYHCVFTGNPGTGKTTVARIVAEIYKELGILKKGHLVETDRSGLVAEYVGLTAVKTNKIIDTALDGVLFIDEAYSLISESGNDYGKEAIATLLKRMEDNRDRLVVILAGYTTEMQQFIDSNPGLQSRFNRYIEFSDYSDEELYQIFELNLKQFDYTIAKDAIIPLQEYLTKIVVSKDKNFGNARFVRNLFEKTIERQANRLSMEVNLTNEKLSKICFVDIPM